MTFKEKITTKGYFFVVYLYLFGCGTIAAYAVTEDWAKAAGAVAFGLALLKLTLPKSLARFI